MTIESEIKLLLDGDHGPALEQWLPGVAIVHEKDSRHLKNTYFDTPTWALRKLDMGLRIRCGEGEPVQTIKTAGRVVGGLHQRPEYNTPAQGELPDLAQFPAQIWPPGLELEVLQQALVPLFTTDFQRQRWLLLLQDGSSVELVMDRGEIRTDSGSEPISELEIELKQGRAESLFALAGLLAEHFPVRLGALSKAARGYLLATGQPWPCRGLWAAPLTQHHNLEQALEATLGYGLEHWLYHQQVYLHQGELAALAEINQGLALINQAFELFSDWVPLSASAGLRQELRWLCQALAWVPDGLQVEQLLDNRGHRLRKLAARDELVALLTQQQRQYPDRESVSRLLTGARTGRLQLALSTWLHQRTWQTSLDEQGRWQLSQPVKPFADATLSQLFTDVKIHVLNQRSLDMAGYQHQFERLNRLLLAGVMVGALYDAESRREFRVSWLDLCQGTEELLSLERLHQLAASCQDEAARQQLLGWVERKQKSLLAAMEQTRRLSLRREPYWD